MKRRTPIQKAIDTLAADPRIKAVWSEGDNGCEGYRPGYVEDVWADLARGFVSELGTHCIHESTPAQLLQALADVEPCDCNGCLDALSKVAL